ncbi:uncharacterized protein [Asterias amurensis]|uniref:uncharacterized protein n=1 Tax=Asterias amurensis TaxID=7602 RepID=UPI003AB4F0F7
MHQRPTPSTSTGIPSTSADVQTQSDEPGPSTSTAEKTWSTDPRSASAKKVAAILDSTWTRKDVKMLSPSMEGIHSVINQYAPEMFSFSYEGMLCRIYLAALHFNENTNRAQAMDREGNPAFSICYPRAKQTTGGYTVRKVLIKATHNFSKRIMEKVLLLCAAGADTRAKYPELKANPGYLTAKVTRPDKTQAVKEFVSRFGKAVEPVGRPEGTEGVVVPASKATKK